MPVTSCSARGTDELLGRSLNLVAPLRQDVGYDKQFDAIIDCQEMVNPGVAGICWRWPASPCAHRQQLARVSIAHFRNAREPLLAA